MAQMVSDEFRQWVHNNAMGTIGGDYEVKDGETAQQWLARYEKAGSIPLTGGYGASKVSPIISQLNKAATDPIFQKYFPGYKYSGPQNSNTDGAPVASPNGNAKPDYTQQIQDFYKMMMDPNAPELHRAGAQGVNMGQRSFGNAGIRGGLSDAGIAKAGMDSRGALFNQRAGMGLQALQTGSNREMGLGASGLARDEFNRESSNQQYNKDQATQQAVISGAGQAVKLGIDAYGAYNKSGGGGGLQNSGGGGPEGYGTSQPSDWQNPYGGGGY